MSRTPQYFSDPLRFDPDASPENKAARPKFTYFPFGGGSRQCIGESFAWMEASSPSPPSPALALSYLGTTHPSSSQDHPSAPRSPHDATNSSLGSGSV